MAISDWFRRKKKSIQLTASIMIRSTPADFSDFLAAASVFLSIWIPGATDGHLKEEPDGGSLEGVFHVAAFSSLHLSLLMHRVATKEEIPIERVCHFWRIGPPCGGDQKLAHLIARLAKLLPAFSEAEALALLDNGVVGDLAEIGPIRPPFNTPQMVVKLLRVVVGLKDWHDPE